MERLEVEGDTPYSALESAIHISRYVFAKSACVGQSVLDVACGVGYGSALLAQWGAKSVDGVDISSDAVASAKRVFASPHLTFATGRAEEIDQIYESRHFDLIVSFETIEHVEDPAAFLSAALKVLKPGGTIMISCPNDHWYFPDDAQFNPYHRRKFRFDEIRELTEGLLGPGNWHLGSLAAGYAVAKLAPGLKGTGGQLAMMRSEAVPNAVVVPCDPEFLPRPEDCAYFVGVWGPSLPRTSVAFSTLSLKALQQGVFAGADSVALAGQVQALGSRLLAKDTIIEEQLAALSAAAEEHLRARDAAQAENERLASLVEQSTAALSAAEEEHLRARDAAQAENERLASLVEQNTAALSLAHERDSDNQRELRRSRLSIAATAAENRLMRDSVFRLQQNVLSLQQVAQQVVDLRTDYSALQRHADELTEGRDYLERRAGTLERERDDLQRRCNDLLRHYKKLQEDHASLTESLQELQKEQDVLIQEKTELKEYLAQANAVIGSVPWRAVAVYRKLRRCTPGTLLRLSATVVDGVAARKRGIVDDR